MQNEIQTQDIVTVMVKGLDTVRSLYQNTFHYECAEIGGATKFTLYWDNVEIGQRIIYPGAFGGSPSVSDVFTAKDRTGGGIFENICKRLDDALDERLAEARKAETSADNGQWLQSWHGTGQPPKTKAEKLAAIQVWDSMNEFDRPVLAEWLESNFGTAPNGDLAVAESTFHGWRNLKKP